MSTSTEERLDEEDYWIYRRKGLFDWWRHVPFSTQYEAMKTPVTVDAIQWRLFTAIVAVTVAFAFVVPGFRKSERVRTTIRIVFGLFVSSAILLSNFGPEWEVAHLKTKTPYRAGLRESINASIGAKIGLRGVNITLRTDPKTVMFEGEKFNETIDYNERLSWDNDGWTLGTIGFGPTAGKFNQDFRRHKRKGSPYPILRIAEYFTLDGEGTQWGRCYLQAGYFTHMLLWTAFASWIIALVLFRMVLRYAGYASLATGACLGAGAGVYASVRNPTPLTVPFEDGRMEFRWGWSFWLCIVTGVLCFIIGAVVVVCDEFAGDQLTEFFGIDFAQDMDEIYLDDEETSAVCHQTRIPPSSRDSPVAGPSHRQVELMEEHMVQPSTLAPAVAYRKKSIFRTRTLTVRRTSMAAAVAPVNQTTTAKDDADDDDDDDAYSQWSDSPSSDRKRLLPND